MRDSIVIPGRVASQFEEEMKSKQKELRTAEFDLELALGELEDDWVMDEDRNGSDMCGTVSRTHKPESIGCANKYRPTFCPLMTRRQTSPVTFQS